MLIIYKTCQCMCFRGRHGKKPRSCIDSCHQLDTVCFHEQACSDQRYAGGGTAHSNNTDNSDVQLLSELPRLNQTSDVTTMMTKQDMPDVHGNENRDLAGLRRYQIRQKTCLTT